MDSIWRKTASLPSFDALSGDSATDVLIIGGGMAGILTARELSDRGVDCMLVEAKKICSGVTENTTAKITLQHGLIYDKMIRRFGVDRTYAYVCAQKEAMESYKKPCPSSRTLVSSKMRSPFVILPTNLRGLNCA